MSRSLSNRSVKGALTTTLLLLIALTAVALIGISPIALGAFHGATDRWERLSFIGQTYGAASAIISVLALVGIVLTLSYQARETKLAPGRDPPPGHRRSPQNGDGGPRPRRVLGPGATARRSEDAEATALHQHDHR
ncbi:DUF6082 family protein [Actinoallomurus soli]|uniref:DUF6082 family protein n=1 Tax=Actinoallomurus soli TaxID=2952535 RepID=UPI0020922047|nr:DUF6082 family protein [Actinoallomurus soli]MCO5971751.1 DUF6082 family protein [Actinoallomurus soli]